MKYQIRCAYGHLSSWWHLLRWPSLPPITAAFPPSLDTDRLFIQRSPTSTEVIKPPFLQSPNEAGAKSVLCWISSAQSQGRRIWAKFVPTVSETSSDWPGSRLHLKGIVYYPFRWRGKTTHSLGDPLVAAVPKLMVLVFQAPGPV